MKWGDKKLWCGDCHLCCTGKVLVTNVYKCEISSPNLDLVPYGYADDQIRKTADGRCVHLDADGCTIYEDRPYTCRSFDCRDYLNHTIEEYRNNYSKETVEFIEELQRAARALNCRTKQSIARRFNDALKKEGEQ